MARIIILGNKYSDELSTRLKAELVEVPDLYANDLGSINDFVVCRLKSKFDVLIIDVDNIQRTDVALALGLYLRLSFAELGTNSLVPIIIASDKRIKSFLHIPNCSQLLLTKSVYFQSRTEIDTQNVLPLDANKYKTDFLDFINIPSGPVGRHSLANQWGASALSRMVSANEVLQNDSLINAQKTLYFKYVFAKTTDNIEPYLNPSKDKETPKKLPSKVNANGKRILLIDDEADKGWATVLDTMLVGNKLFDVIKDRVPNYDSLSADSRNKIESNIYDLIFLDLRMNGDAEENNLEPEKFSGMDILKKIKSLNKGTQVIIFTASNKAWNLKALLDAGADGYYIKESPELLFPYDVSYGNYMALQKTIKRCFERWYLREIFTSITTIKESLPQNDFGESISKQLNIAYYLISLAETQEQYAFAYVTLYLIIELINKEFLIQNANGNWCIKSNQDEKIKAWSNEKKVLLDFSYVKDEFGNKIKDNNGNDVVVQIAANAASEWQKIVGIIKQQWKVKAFDNKLVELSDRVRARNWFIHGDSKLDDCKRINDNVFCKDCKECFNAQTNKYDEKLRKAKRDNNECIFSRDTEREIYSKEGFRNLFKIIKLICSFL